MFSRRIFAAAAAFVAAVSAQATLSITNPSPSSWWVSASVNTLAWDCSSSPSAFNVVLTNTNTSILSSPFALISDVPNYDCSLTVTQQQSSLAPSDTWTILLTDILNISNIYTSTPFTIKPVGSVYPTASSSSAASGTSTSTAGSSSSTSISNKNGAVANYIPVGMSMVAAIALGLVVA